MDHMKLKLTLIIFFLSHLCLMIHIDSMALEYNWGSHPDHERVVFEFQGEKPGFDVLRTGRQELTLNLPADIWQRESQPSPGTFPESDLLERLDIHNSNIVLSTTTSSFGFISFVSQDNVVIDIFFDSFGDAWSDHDFVSAPLDLEPVPPPVPDDTPIEQPAVREILPRADGSPVVDQDEPPADESDVRHRLRMPVQMTTPEQVSLMQPDDEPGANIVRRSISRVESEPPPPEAEIQEPEVTEADPIAQEPAPEVVYPDLDYPEQVHDMYADRIFAAQAMMSGADFRPAVRLLESMLDDPELPEEHLKEVLYTYANANFQMLRSEMRDNYTDIVAPFERAINYDPNSPRVADALMNLGYINLRVGNEPEARGYFNLLRDSFPDDPNVPSTYFYWGDYFENQGLYEEAVEQFEYIIQEFPEDDLVQPAALALARTLSELDFHEDALDILDFIENRWPRYYIDDPDALIRAGYILYQNDKLDEARERFLHYINLRPDGEHVPVSMARIGDIYLLQGRRDAAREMHEETVRKYPDEEGGLIAAMRLAEEGIYDDPRLSDFDRPFSMRPRAIYRRISEEFPESPLASVALLKLAMWDIHHGYFNYVESLEAIERFYELYSHKELWPRALEIGFEAFSSVVAQDFPEKDFENIIETWETYSYLNEHPEMLSSEARVALASAYWHSDRAGEALALAQPLLDEPEIDEHNYAALSLLMSIYLETSDWESLKDLASHVRDWDLPRDDRLQVDYAEALAMQNTALEDEALPIWRRLAVERDFPGSQRAFALFFLAWDAFERSDYQNVYIFAQEALAQFMEQEEQNVNRIMTCLDMLIEATSKTGRVREALVWALEYENYITRDDPDWPAFQYRLARIYRMNNQFEQWERTLRRIIREFPDDMYSRMARSEINTRRLTSDAEQYRP